ncbi:MAG: metallophosphoesterase [Oscillospiraceae bacterium]
MGLTVAQLNNVTGRVLVVSDVHAMPTFFEQLLIKAQFCHDDTLILLGDMIEKGPDSLTFLRYLMDFAKEHENVRFVRGNCDDLPLDFVRGDGMSPKVFWDYLTHHPESILWQMGDAVGCHPKTTEELPLLRRAVAEHFQPELEFIGTWPVILESETMIFVHGGVPSCKNMEGLDPWRCMKNDNFLDRDVHLEKWCVVGHTPVTLYHRRVPSAEPIICREKHIISIDGGCGLKLDGQLNALIIPFLGSEDFSWVSYDGLKTVVALEPQAPSKNSLNLRWGDDEVEILEQGPEFCRCRHRSTGYELDILTDYIYEKNGRVRCEDSTDFELEVVAGEALGLVRHTTRGILAKKVGVTGWYRGKFSVDIDETV